MLNRKIEIVCDDDARLGQIYGPESLALQHAIGYAAMWGITSSPKSESERVSVGLFFSDNEKMPEISVRYLRNDVQHFYMQGFFNAERVAYTFHS